MEQKSVAKWLKFILIGVGLCGLAVHFLIIPSYGQALASENPDYAHCYLPWLLFLWGSGIPCYIVLFLGWKIAGRIGRDQSFSYENANSLKWIAYLAAGDGLYFFAGNLLFLSLNISHPGVALCSLIVVFAGVAVAVATAALSHFVKKAADLQEQSELTI